MRSFSNRHRADPIAALGLGAAPNPEDEQGMILNIARIDGWTLVAATEGLLLVQVDPRDASQEAAAVEILRADTKPSEPADAALVLMGGERLTAAGADDLGTAANLYARAVVPMARLLVTTA